MIDYYDPKFLRGAIRNALPARLFFRSRYFTDVMTFPNKTVTFEFAKNSRSLLPFSEEHLPAPSIARAPYQAKTFVAPLLSGARVITADTLSQKLMGETPWNSGLSPNERAREIAATDLMELQDALFRQEEYMCARLKQDGKLTIDGNGYNSEIDYGFTQIETITQAAQKWNANYDIPAKLSKVARELRKKGINPDTLIIGSDVAEALNSNEAVQKLRHDELIDVPKPDSLEDGVTFVCVLRAPGIYLNVYEYNEYYSDASGELKPLVDPGTVIMQSSRERNFMLYGAVTYIDSKSREYITEMSEYVPYVVTQEDPPMRKLIVSSRVLPMPQDIESWYVLKNVC